MTTAVLVLALEACGSGGSGGGDRCRTRSRSEGSRREPGSESDGQLGGVMQSLAPRGIEEVENLAVSSGTKSYALYHGAHGKDYAMAMERVEGNWMVDALLTIELP
jgi:hypothetical protein